MPLTPVSAGRPSPLYPDAEICRGGSFQDSAEAVVLRHADVWSSGRWYDAFATATIEDVAGAARIVESVYATEGRFPELLLKEDEAWAASQQEARGRLEKRFGASVLPAISPAKSSYATAKVVRCRIDGVRAILRLAAEGSAALRKEYAAAWLNERMGLETAPRARLVSENGAPSLWCDYAPGWKPWIAMLPGLLRRGSLADALAFEFLAGNADVHDDNYAVDARGGIKIVDHDHGFFTALLAFQYSHDPSDYGPFGLMLPRRYTPGFTGAVAELTDEVLFAGLADYLTIEELRGVAFRRDMILVDIESRAPGCFMEADDVNERATGIGTLLYGAACFLAGEG